MKAVFGILGAIALSLIVADYGAARLIQDFQGLSWWVLVLVLTFIPTLICYSFAWQLSTRIPLSLRFLPSFVRMSTISLAWNNLTPFLKVGGEPLKVFMLESHISRLRAIESTLVYNLIHAMGSLWAIILVAALLPFFYHLSPWALSACLVTALIGISIFLLCLIVPLVWHSRMKRSSFEKCGWRSIRFIRKAIISLCWTIKKCQRFIMEHPYRSLSALVIEVFARFVEGLTFFLAFKLLHTPIDFLGASFLEVGRTLFDNLFFFIPYQAGSREQGVRVIMDQILYADSRYYLAATFLYRFVEIAWVIIGYILWSLKRSKKR